MSHYETPEQRRIRELNNQVSSLRSQMNRVSSDNNRLISRIQSANDQIASLNRIMSSNDAKHSAEIASARNEAARALRQSEENQRRILADMSRNHELQIEAMNSRFQREQNNLSNQIGQTRQEMKEGFRQIREETRSLIDAEQQRTDALIASTRADLMGEINTVDSKVDNLIARIRNDKAKEKDTAQTWIEEARRLLSEINDDIPSQLIDPVMVQRINENLVFAENNLNNGIYSAAITNAQTAYRDARTLLGDSRIALVHWQDAMYRINARMNLISAHIQTIDNFEGFQLDLGDMHIADDHDLDYWSYGRVSDARGSIERLAGTDTGNMTVAELEAFEENLITADENLLDAQNTARTNFTMSCSRLETASHIADTLGDGFLMDVCGGDYFSKDPREEYRLVCDNPTTGDVATLDIVPLVDPDTKIVTNHVDLLVDDASNNLETRTQINNAVEARLDDESLIDPSRSDSSCSERYGEQTHTEVSRRRNLEEFINGVQSARRTEK